jgi:hypothetical protein
VTGVATYEPVQTGLAGALLAHLDAQIASAGRLLASILAQGAAIRERNVEGVLSRLAEVKTEMSLRSSLEEQRANLLMAAGNALAVPAEQVTLDAMTRLMPAAHAVTARERSSELRGLLAEIAREHGLNRALMRQELSFLDHLTRLIGQEPDTGYSPNGADRTTASVHRVLDTQA